MMLKTRVDPWRIAYDATSVAKRRNNISSRAYARMDASSTHTRGGVNKNIILSTPRPWSVRVRRDCKKSKRFSRLLRYGSNRFEDRATS
eukprot:6991594-Prymnesium_polylepis.1